MMGNLSDPEREVLERAVKVVLSSGLSTGHADTIEDLIREVISQGHPRSYEIVGRQAVEIMNLKEMLTSYRESHEQIHNIIYCIGGPLNDNKLQYSKDQRSTFHQIAGELIDPCDYGCECPCH